MPRPRLPVVLSGAALIVAIAALAIAVLHPSGSRDPACQGAAWNSVPVASSLPSGWSISASGFFVDSVSATLVGPSPSDDTSQPPTVYVSVGCYGSSGHDALVRSHLAALAHGETDLELADFGDESFATRNGTTGSMSVYLRRGDLVGSVAASGTLDLSDLERVTAGLDGAMARAQPNTAGASLAAPPSRLPSAAPSASPTANAHMAPDLEAMLPTSFQDTALTRDSTDGASATASDDTARATLTNALKALGKVPADVSIARAYDDSGTIDLTIIALRAQGVTAGQLRPALRSWLTGGTAGVKSSTSTISGKTVVTLTYPDGGANDYLYDHGEVLFDVVTSDAAVAKAALALLP
jgi:hypothetical protein